MQDVDSNLTELYKQLGKIQNRCINENCGFFTVYGCVYPFECESLDKICDIKLQIKNSGGVL